MNKERGALPKPFGESFPVNESRSAFQRIIRQAPDLQIYDGDNDYDSRILKYAESKKKVQGLIVDDTVPPLPEKMIREKKPFLARAQYFQEGLHHRLSFYVVVVKQGEFENYPALWLQIIPPIKRVSNLYVSMIQDDKPVYLEIPIQGAPPQVRVMEMSMEKMKVFSGKAAKLFPTQQYLKGVKVQMVNIGEAQVSGPVTQTGDDEAELEIQKMSKKSKDAISSYMEEDFTEKFNPNREKDPAAAPRATPAEKEKKDPARSDAPPRALLLLQNAQLNRIYTEALKEIGYQCLNPASILDVKREHLADVGLVVMDSEQEGHHAVDWLSVWIDKQWMLPGRFVIVAESTDQFRRDEWRPLGKGLALRTNYPEQWVGQRLREWLGVKKKEEMAEEEAETERLVLVADDEPDMLDITSSLLVENGFKVVTAMNGREVVREAKNRKPDLILLDLKMPEYDGLQALNTIRSFSLTKETPVIIISGYYGPEHVH
ncbi:response regulator, partial [bacterium]|nr:response regulator [bacterium]